MAAPVSREMVTGPVALVQVRVKVEPGVTSNSVLVKAGVATTAAARLAMTEKMLNFILSECGG